MKDKRFDIAIIGGCGHVGLPLGIAFAKTGKYRVVLVDRNEKAVAEVNRGIVPFVEEGGNEALQSVAGTALVATTATDAVRNAEFVVFVTGTPVDEHLNPRVQDVTEVIDQYMPLLNPRQLVILRSTLYPGVTELIARRMQEQKPGIGIAFCPERVAQGYALEEIAVLPQIVSGCDKESEERASRLFGTIAPECLHLTTREAELAKLFANGWRYIECAIANQFYMMAEGAGVDFYRVHQALSHKYPRGHFMRAGFAAGPCLFKDTMQLSAFHSNGFFLGHAAMLINEGLPQFVVQQLEKKLGELAGKRIGILGMAFKANNDDIRDSLSYKLKKIFESKGAIVLDTDVYQESHARLPQVIKESDALVLAVPHDEYRDLEPGRTPFVDCWGVWQGRPDLSVSAQPTALLKKSA